MGQAPYAWLLGQEAMGGATFELTDHSWSQELPSAVLVNSKLISIARNPPRSKSDDFYFQPKQQHISLSHI